jgi:hypothetical protein
MAFHILFRLGDGVAALPPSGGLTGGWGAGGLVGYRPGQPQRIRRLSELDEPEDELLFTPEDVAEAIEAKPDYGPPNFAAIELAFRLRRERVAEAERAIAEAYARELEDEDEIMLL